MLNRRAFFNFIACGLSLLTFRSFAQPAGKVFRLGYLSLLSPDPASAGGEFFLGLKLALAKAGYVAYGPYHREIFDLAAEYVAKILSGMSPGDLPVQQPTRFALVVNARTATVLGLTTPPSILARACEVIR